MSGSVNHVDPFIGVDVPGNCLCGPYLPLGLARPGPDTTGLTSETSGYRSGERIRRFTQTHVNGMGGLGRLGNIGVMPYLGETRREVEPAAVSDEAAAAAFYACTFAEEGIRTEVTATRKVGVYRFAFPAEQAANILFDVGAVLELGETDNMERGRCIGGFAEALSATELIGRGDFKGGWGHSFPYSVFVYARLDRPAEWSLWNAAGESGDRAVDGEGCTASAHLGSVGEAEVRVGVSFVSVANARAAVDAECADRSFDEIRHGGAQTWQNLFDRVQVRGGTPAQQTLFYTMFYRLFSMPTDLGVDDENPFWKSGVRQFSEIICLWDSVRNANSLLMLLAPDQQKDLLNALIDIAEHTGGWLPDAWIGGHSAYVQGGSSADIIFSEAARKGLGGVDYARALELMRRNAEVPSDNPRLHGRFLEGYESVGFVPEETPHAVSRHLEYTYQDWCIGALAEWLGESETAAHYFRNSRRIWNLWREEILHFAPRAADGQWVEPFDPQNTRWDCWHDPYFYEGTSSQWSYSTHHDFAGLIKRCGGNEDFVNRLDRFFSEPERPLHTGGYHSKESMLHVPYLYINAGRPDKTQACVRECLERHFRCARNGLTDNEDMGCQSTFFMASAMGLYPVMGQDLYWLTSPLFEETVVELGGGKALRIEAPGADEQHIYIASATLNGAPLDRAWLRHAEIAGGATLRFELSAEPTRWGRNNPPPSPLSDSRVWKEEEQ